MNTIFVIIDSVRRDHLGVYGNDWIQTPNLDALASKSVVFETDIGTTAIHPTGQLC